MYIKHINLIILYYNDYFGNDFICPTSLDSDVNTVLSDYFQCKSLTYSEQSVLCVTIRVAHETL